MRSIRECQHSRTVGNVVAGCVAGLLKASAAYGALIYLTASLLVSLAVMVKTAFQPGVYFASARKSVLLKDLLSRSSILTYILFWTMFLSFR